MEVTGKQPQASALAAEIERLQGLVVMERAARDELRRRFLKMTAPRPPPLDSAQIDTRDAQSAKARPRVEPPRVESQPETTQATTDSDASAADAQQRGRVSVVHQIQQAEQSVAADNSQQTGGGQRRRGFSIWGFITGEDRLRT